MNANAPLLSVHYTVTPELFEICNLKIGERIKKRNMPRMLVVGSVFAVGAVGFLLYMFFYLHSVDTLSVVLSVLLFLLGMYNLLYYPVLFPRMLRMKAAETYKSTPGLGTPMTLEFHEEYFEEITSEKRNRIQWKAVRAVIREDEYYLLRLTSDSGILLPRDALDDTQLVTLNRMIEEKLAHQTR